MFWLPSYFASTFKLNISDLSPELMIIYTMTIAGSVGGGYFSSWLIKRGWPTLKARKTALFIFAIMELTVLSAQFATNAWMVVGILSFTLAFIRHGVQIFLLWLLTCSQSRLQFRYRNWSNVRCSRRNALPLICWIYFG